MKRVLIRDDDLCFFSEPARVEETYGFLFDQNLPVNFSVIPNVDASARTNSSDFGAGTFEPFIPESYRGSDACYSVLDNPELIAYLRERKGVEILQHGYRHSGAPGNYEFESTDPTVIAEKIQSGASVLSEAFGQRPTTFVAPQDKYSRVAFNEIEAQFKIFSLGWVDRRRIPFRLLPSYYAMKLRHVNVMKTPRATCIEHPGVIFSQFKNTDAEVRRFRDYLQQHAITVLVLHHWEFYEGAQLNQTLHGKFKDLVNSIADSSEQHFCNFHELDV